MQRNRTAIVLGLLAIAVLGFFLFRQWDRPLTEAERLGRQSVTRPGEITPRLVDDLSLKINGVDWLAETPTVESGSHASVVTHWKGEVASNEVITTLYVVPRLETSPEFDWFDVRVEKLMPIQASRQMTEKMEVTLAPGTYLVRLYLQSQILDEQLELTEFKTDLLAERKLIITPHAQGMASTIIPGDEPKYRGNVYTTRWESRDPRKE